MHPRSCGSTIAFALIALALAGCGASEDGGDPTTSSAGTSTLFLAGIEEMWVVDVESERVDHLRVPELSGGDPPHSIAAIGDRLALWGYDVATVPTADPSAPSSTLAKGGWIFIPAADPDRIWVALRDRERPRAERAVGELREIDAEGNLITRVVEPPGGAWPYAALTRGLLFEGPEGVRLWDPDEQSTIRSHRRREIGDMGPVSGDLLASCLDDCDELLLTDFATGDQRRIRAPSGHAFVVGEAEFSPDGATLAVPVTEAGGGSPWAGERELALVSLDDGEVGIVPGATVPGGYVFTAWSRDGGKVFMTGGDRVTGGDQGTPRLIVAHDVGAESARRLGVQVGAFYDIAAR